MSGVNAAIDLAALPTPTACPRRAGAAYVRQGRSIYGLSFQTHRISVSPIDHQRRATLGLGGLSRARVVAEAVKLRKPGWVATKPAQPRDRPETDMTATVEEKNKALVLEAFDTLFNKRDYAKA